MVMRMLRMLAWLRTALVVVAAANFLDITSSLIPSPADHMVPMPQRSPLEWVVQLLGVVLFVPWLWRRVPALARTYRALPIAPGPRALLAAFVMIELAHIALRFERFPWSPVAMFSSAVPVVSDDANVRLAYLIAREDEIEAVSMLREGSPWFARHGLGFDYKAGWTMHMYATTHSAARDVLFRRVSEEGLPVPARVHVRYSRATGGLLPSGPALRDASSARERPSRQ
jgi:hypothetical protein